MRTFLVTLLAALVGLGWSCAERPGAESAASASPEASPPPSSSVRPVETVVQADTGFYQELSWSPDGRTLLLSVLEPSDDSEGFTYRIFRIGADGSGFRPLTDGPRDYWTAWSPDGSRIAFASRRQDNLDIYVMDAGGGGWNRLTDAPEEDTHPQWSPDGERIVFVSRRSGEPEIYVMSAEGTGQRQIGEAEGEVWNPVWSPDGRHLVFYQTEADGDDHVWVMNADGSEPRRLAAGVWPAWSPDGSRIIYGRSDGLYEIRPDGTGERRLVDGEVNFGRFSQDGARLAYIETASGEVSVHIAGPDGSERTTLLRRPKPSW